MGKLRTRLLRHGAHPDEVDDIVHDAILRLMEYQTQEPVRNPAAFLSRVGHNLFLDRLRHKARWGEVAEEEILHQIADLNPGQTAIAEARERLAWLETGVARLPAKTQRILLARRIDGLSVRAIAAQEGMTIAAIEKQIARATYRLLQWMEEW